MNGELNITHPTCHVRQIAEAIKCVKSRLDPVESPQNNERNQKDIGIGIVDMHDAL